MRNVVMKPGVRTAQILYEVIDGTMRVTRSSELTGKSVTMDIPGLTEGQLKLWCSPDGPLIQTAMPHVSNEHREFLLTGITPEEWKEIYPEDD